MPRWQAINVDKRSLDHGQLDIGHGEAGKSWIHHHECASSATFATEPVKVSPDYVLHVGMLCVELSWWWWLRNIRVIEYGTPELVMMSCSRTVLGTYIYIAWRHWRYMRCGMSYQKALGLGVCMVNMPLQWCYFRVVVEERAT